jgi:hypothetical protein
MPVSVVQTAVNQITTLSTNWDATFASAVTPGNVVVVIARLGTNTRTMGAPTYTGGGGTFAAVVSNNPTSLGGLAMWSKIEETSGVLVYRISIGSSLTAVGVQVALELSGCDGATASVSGTGTQGTTTTSPQMLDTGLDISSGGIMIGGISTQANASWGTLTAPGSFNPISAAITGTGQISHFIGHRTTSGTAIQGTATTTTGRTIYGIAATWIEAAGGQPYAKRWGGVPHFGGRSQRRW